MGLQTHIPKTQAATALRLMRSPAGVPQRKCACGGVSGAGGCEECKRKKQVLQRRAASSDTSAVAPPIVHDVLRSPGEPLDTATREFFEPRFGHDFSRVRVHADGRASQSARAVNALAYTVGEHVVFATGRYAPSTPSGRELLTHELTHVTQQSGLGLPSSLRVGSPSDPCERQAESVAARAANIRAAAPLQPAPGVIQRQGAGKPACDAAKQSEKRSACIEPVLIADNDGKNPTSMPSVAEAQNIWKKCCIDLTVAGGKTIKKSAYKTPTVETLQVSADETSLFGDAGDSNCIQVLVPSQFSKGGASGKDIWGGGRTSYGGTAHPRVVIVEGAVGEVLAHEIGHALGHVDHDANATVMKPTGHYNVANPTAVSADVCTKAQSGAVETKQGNAKDCCMTL